MPKRRFRVLALAICLFAGLCAGIFARLYADTAGRFAEASGDSVYKNTGMVVDYSHSDCGYLCVKSSGNRNRLKLRIEKDGAQYTYDLRNDGEYEVYPLQEGSGSYSLKLYELVSGSSYRPLSSLSVKVRLSDDNIAFLYPNRYVDYDADTKAVAKSLELCAQATNDKEKFQIIWEYVTGQFVYHYIRSLTVDKGYVPDIDLMLEEGMGICFDFAALTACMLRVQGIPTQLVIGYADKASHAWNNVLIDGQWMRYDATAKVTNSNFREYTESGRY